MELGVLNNNIAAHEAVMANPESTEAQRAHAQKCLPGLTHAALGLTGQEMLPVFMEKEVEE